MYAVGNHLYGHIRKGVHALHGKDADIMMFDKDLKLTYVMQMGNEVTNEL